MPDYLSGVSSVAIGLPFSTLDSFSCSILRVLATCPGCLGLYAPARVRVYKSLFCVFSFMREEITLSTLDTLSSNKQETVFKRVLMSRVMSRVGLFLSGVGISGGDL